MFRLSLLRSPAQGRCFGTITRLGRSTSLLRLRRNSSQPCPLRFHDTSSCGTSASRILVPQITRYDSCAMLRATVPLTQPQNGVPDEFTVSGAEWFRKNNFTVLPLLLVNPVALYGYGDINIVPAVRHTTHLHLQGLRMHTLTRDSFISFNTLLLTFSPPSLGCTASIIQTSTSFSLSMQRTRFVRLQSSPAQKCDVSTALARTR
jgi:hypothetical protein